MHRQITFWLLALAATLLFFWYLQDILLPFIAGFVVAYFLDPVAHRLQRLGLSRLMASIAILIGVSLIIVLAFVLVVPAMASQIGKLVSEIPTLSQQLMQLVDQWAPQWLKDLVTSQGGDLPSTLNEYGGKIALWIASFASTIWSGSKALVNIVSLLIITPVVAFYLLLDWPQLVRRVDAWLPRQHKEELRQIFWDIDRSLAGYIRGQGTVCLILAIFYGLAFWLVGLKSGLAIGIAMGLLAFIPFFGALFGGALAVVVGLVQFWPNELHVLGIVGVLVVGQLVESNFLSPKLVGELIGLHPVWMMLALFAFAYVFGILGLLLAVPLAATTGVLVRHGLARYLESDIYLGRTGRRHG